MPEGYLHEVRHEVLFWWCSFELLGGFLKMCVTGLAHQTLILPQQPMANLESLGGLHV